MSGTSYSQNFDILTMEIANDPINFGYAGMTSQQIVDRLLLRDRERGRGVVTAWELINAVAPADMPTLRLHADRWYFDDLVAGVDININAPNIEAVLAAIFAEMPTSLANLQALSKALASRAMEINLPEKFITLENVNRSAQRIMEARKA